MKCNEKSRSRSAAEHPRNKRKWTPEEDRKVLEYVRTSVCCLTRGFENVASVIGRTPKACEGRWYNVLSKNPAVREFGTLSSAMMMYNRKIGVGTPVKKGLWNRLLQMLGIRK